MRNLLKIAIILMICGNFLPALGAAYGQDQTNTNENSAQKNVPEQQKTVIGVVANVNVFDKTVTVLDYWQRATQFHLFNAEIRTSNDDVESFATVNDLHPGNRVQITYFGTASEPQNLKIVILPRDTHGIYQNNPYDNEY